MDKEDKGETRRDFISQITSGILSLSVAGTLIAGKTLAAGKPPGSPLATVNVGEHQELQQIGGYILVKKTPVGDLLIARSGEAEYTALSTVCPHLQCNVKVRSSSLIQCPCHQSGYKLDGSYISGPAKKGLRKFPLTMEGNAITVWTQTP